MGLRPGVPHLSYHNYHMASIGQGLARPETLVLTLFSF